jgi:hypothetical protein
VEGVGWQVYTLSVQELDVMARAAGLRRMETWVDDGGLFSLSWLVAI